MKVRRIGMLPTFEVAMPMTLQRFFDFLDLKIEYEGETHALKMERVKVEPLDIRENLKEKWDLLVDRTTHWHSFIRAYVQHAAYDGVYVLNHTNTFNVINKHASFVFLERLGSAIPRTILIPPNRYVDEEEYVVAQLKIKPGMTREKFEKELESYRHYRDVWLPEMFRHHNVLFDFDAIPERIGGYPFYLKPAQDGGGGAMVSRIENPAQFHEKYEESRERVMHAQEAIEYDKFVRCMGIGPQVYPMKYVPDAPFHKHYSEEPIELTDSERRRVIGEVKIVNAVFRWEYNSYEALIKDGVVHPIDFANACPDSSIISLHVHFPWVIKALVKWITFCAVTDRPMQIDLNQREYLEAGGEDASPEERFEACLSLAERYFEQERFEEFVERHLSFIDEAFVDFWNKGRLDDIIVHEIEVSRFPKHEHPRLIEEYRDKLRRSIEGGMC